MSLPRVRSLLKFSCAAILAVSAGAVSGAPAPVFTLPEKLNGQPMGRFLSLSTDRTGTIAIDNIGSHDAEFSMATKDAPSFGFSSSAHWARFRIHNPKSKPQSVALALAVPSLDSAILFCLPPGPACKPIDAGDHQPFANRPFRHRFPVYLIQLPGKATQEYALRLSSTGAVAFPIQVWEPALLRRHVQQELLLFGVYYGLMIAMLIYNTFLLIAVRDISYLFYSLFILTFTLLQACIDGNAFRHLWPGGGQWTDITVPGAMYAMAMAASQFTRTFIDTRVYAPTFDKLLAGFVGLCGLGLAYVGVAFALELRILVFPSNVAMLGGIALGLGSAGIALKRGSRPAFFYLIGWSGFLLSSTLLILRSVGLVPNFAVLEWGTQIGSAALVMLLSLGLADLINNMRRRLAAYNVELEREVEERTRDLNASLDEVRRLNYKQIGDYYLISLLSNPLSRNVSSLTLIKAESLIRQHKRFSFKDRESEIGGDLCITDRVTLGDKHYLVFLNADAMGKSIQGAGGSIVLGAVFSTLLERTRYSADMQSHSPERWLHYAYKELDRVFYSFGGNMLVSCVVGFVEEGTNCLYFINAEHPAPILLRGGKAEFVPVASFHPRLGAGLKDTERCPISVIGLQPGDLLISGSDGRDDIRLGGEESPGINTDERVILSIVEAAGGDLEQCYELLRQSGELTDDLSLVRIEIPEDGPLLESGEGLEALRRRGRSELADREYARAADTLLKLVHADPAVTEHLHTAAKSLKRAGRTKEAADLGERYFLRAPRDARGMVNLAEVHIRNGNRIRALRIIQLLEALAPEHPRLAALKTAATSS